MTVAVEVLRHLSDPTFRAVAENWHAERGTWSHAAWLVRLGLMPAVAVAANANADAYAEASAHTDADAYAEAYANTRAYADADAGRNQQELSGGKHLKNGLMFWAQPSGSVVVLRLGWVRRVEGDEYEALHMVTPLRNGDYDTLWDSLAIDGPPKKWKFSRPMPRPSPLNRFHILGPVSLDPKQWAEVCPKPKGWEE